MNPHSTALSKQLEEARALVKLLHDSIENADKDYLKFRTLNMEDALRKSKAFLAAPSASLQERPADLERLQAYAEQYKQLCEEVIHGDAHAALSYALHHIEHLKAVGALEATEERR